MTQTINTCGKGNVVRSSHASTSKTLTSEVNKQLIKATDGQYDYSSGQPEYVGNASCDPARGGSDKLTCCK